MIDIKEFHLQRLLGKSSAKLNINIAGNRMKRKRKSIDIIDQGISGAKAQVMNECVASMDYITQLPDHVILLILSRLPTKDATRTSVLSKKWQHVRDSFSILDFDQRYFQLERREKNGRFKGMKGNFKDYVDRCIHNWHAGKFNVEKFRLYMVSCQRDCLPHMDRWIASATEGNVKELDIHVQANKKKRYSLPQAVFTAEKLTMLSLYGCKLESCNDVQLPLLKNLRLKNLHVNPQTLTNLIVSCPLIEDLRLISCTGLKLLNVSLLLNLKRFEVHFCLGMSRIDAEVPNLQIFWYYGKMSNRCKINLSTCESLKRLTLEDANMTDEMFQHLISKFPILEQLNLSKCNSLKKIKITNHRLDSLSLRGCKNLVDADIDTPNLRAFEYNGDGTIPFSSMDPSHLRKANLSFGSKYIDPKNLAIVQEFLAKINQSRGMKLITICKKNVIIHDEWKHTIFCVPDALKFEVTKPSTNYENLLEHVLRKHHPKNLAIVSSSSVKAHKLIDGKIMEREKEPNCCKYYSNKCWRHYLEEATYGDVQLAEDNPVSLNWQLWLDRLAVSYSAVNVGLKWKHDHPIGTKWT